MALNAHLDIVMNWALATGTTLYSLVGTRVAKRRMPSSFKNTAKALCIHDETTSTEFEPEIVWGTYVFKCYGGTDDADDAAEVFRAVHARFHNKAGDITSGGIVRSTFVTGTLTYEPDTGWPVYIAKFEIGTQ